VGVTTSGDAYAWGRNFLGQLGDGTTTDRTTPGLVSGSHTWASISAGSLNTTGITTSGDAYAWGFNGYGQLGNGTTTDRTTTVAPVLVSGSHTWASISTSSHSHTVGITTSGDAYAWGFNGDGGQLGDGTTTNRSTPVLVSGGHTWASISAGHSHTVGLTTNGDAYAWGCNEYGQLGDGTTTNRSTPVLIGQMWASISTSQSHTVGLTTSGDADCDAPKEEQPPQVSELLKVAEQGNVDAQYNLGRMYANDEGVPEDMVLAYMWWNLAAAQGSENAQDNKDIIEQGMTREQIAEAQRLSREWLEAHPPGGN
jgi:alpha-tubulin suppressor-like RCC1 family protein